MSRQQHVRPRSGRKWLARRLEHLAVPALALVLAGCGGRDDATTPAFEEPPPLTKQEFLFEADRICNSVESQIEAAADDYVGRKRDPSPREVRRLINDVVVPRLRSEVEAIALLDPPPRDAEVIRSILEATERGASALARDPQRILDGLPPELREAERLARGYGSRQCGLR